MTHQTTHKAKKKVQRTKAKKQSLARVRVSKKQSQKRGKASFDLNKLELQKAETMQEIALMSKDNKLAMREHGEKTVGEIIKKLEFIREEMIEHPNKQEDSPIQLPMVDEKLKRYRILMKQFKLSYDMKFLADTDISAYQGDKELFLKNLFIAEEKLELDPTFSYPSIIDTFGSYSITEIKDFSPLFARIIQYTIDADLSENYYLISNFLNVIRAKTPTFLLKMKKILANIEDDEKIILGNDFEPLYKKYEENEAEAEETQAEVEEILKEI